MTDKDITPETIEDKRNKAMKEAREILAEAKIIKYEITERQKILKPNHSNSERKSSGVNTRSTDLNSGDITTGAPNQKWSDLMSDSPDPTTEPTKNKKTQRNKKIWDDIERAGELNNRGK